MGKTHEITSVEVIAPYGVLSDEVIDYLAELLYPMVMEELNNPVCGNEGTDEGR